jgi:hypothetical protein
VGAQHPDGLVADFPPVAVRAVQEIPPPPLADSRDLGQLVADTGRDQDPPRLQRPTTGETNGNLDHPWRFLTNHAHVLTCIGSDPSVRLRDIAATVGITERTAAQIVNDLERAGYLRRRATDAATPTRSTTTFRSATPYTGTTRSAT